MLQEGGLYLDNMGNVLATRKAFANVASGTTDQTLTDVATGLTIATPATPAFIRLLSAYFMAAATATAVTFNSKGSGAGTALGPAWPCAANGGMIQPRSLDGHYDCQAGQVPTVTTGAGSTVAVLVTYVVIPGTVG